MFRRRQSRKSSRSQKGLQNAELTVKAWEKAVQELGISLTSYMYLQGIGRCSCAAPRQAKATRNELARVENSRTAISERNMRLWLLLSIIQ